MTVPAARGPAGRAPHPTVPAARRAPDDAAPVGPVQPPVEAPPMSPRDRAVLMAIAAGRCTMSPERPEGMLVDGRSCTDQFAGHRLLRAGLARLVAQPPGRPCTVELTPTGVALLGLPITL